MSNKNLKMRNVIWEDDIILSGFVRFRPINKTYYLNINSRILGKYLINLKNKTKIKTLKVNDKFKISTDRNGNVLRGDRRGPITCISKNLLTLEDQKKLKSKKTKYSLPFKVIISPKEFGLKKYDLYPDQDAAKLAYALEKRSFKMPRRIMTPFSFKHDLVFTYKNKEILIEITTYKPSAINNRNFKHQSIGSSVWAHVFDVYRDCATDKLNNYNKKIGFVIISKKWKKYQYIIDSLEELDLVGCSIVFTDFKNNKWPEDVSTQITNKLKGIL